MTGEAVCVLIRDGEKILAVSRRGDPDAWGLPGGKVDPGESLTDACVREALEETGLEIADLRPVYRGEVGDGFACTTFAARVVRRARHGPRPGEGAVGWRSEEDLVRGPFGAYNSALFGALRTNET